MCIGYVPMLQCNVGSVPILQSIGSVPILETLSYVGNCFKVILLHHLFLLHFTNTGQWVYIIVLALMIFFSVSFMVVLLV